MNELFEGAGGCERELDQADFAGSGAGIFGTMKLVREENADEETKGRTNIV